MTVLKRLATTTFEALTYGFATWAPFFGVPAAYHLHGMRGPLTRVDRTPR